MLSECVECDRPALRFWGPYAYCRRCLDQVKRERPQDHLCPRCGREARPLASWHRTHPCHDCPLDKRQPGRRLMCAQPDRDVPALECGHPLPCPYHTVGMASR